jgi:predicted dehydrogenase
LFDIDLPRARQVAARFEIENVFASLEEAAAAEGVVFDLATPPGAHAEVLEALPDGAVVLIQKPMGRNEVEATAILEICRKKRFVAAVNFQLRFAPAMLAIRDAVRLGLIGELLDVEAHLAIDTPWDMFAFLKGLARVEIAVHSIHYLDLFRSFLGDPQGVHAKSIGHLKSAMAQTRTSAILDYGDRVRCTLSVNHHHDFGRRHQVAELRFDGAEGAAHVSLGLLLNYPNGEPDTLSMRPKGESEWFDIPLGGGWFPDAFIGRMANLQRFAAGEDADLIASVEDAWSTMALAEAMYRSSAAPATSLSRHP